MTHFKSNNDSLKYQRSTTLVCKGIEIRKHVFVQRLISFDNSILTLQAILKTMKASRLWVGGNSLSKL